MYYTINYYLAGRKVYAMDITDEASNDDAARALFASVCAARSPLFAELAVDQGNCLGYRTIAHYDQYGMHDGDC